MRKLASIAATAAVAAGLILGTAGAAFADDDHSTRDDHSSPQCSREHSVNVATCIGNIANLSGGLLDVI
jgi:hypothetical protein